MLPRFNVTRHNKYKLLVYNDLHVTEKQILSHRSVTIKRLKKTTNRQDLSLDSTDGFSELHNRLRWLIHTNSKTFANERRRIYS